VQHPISVDCYRHAPFLISLSGPTRQVIIAAIACVGSLAAVLTALFPWSVPLLGVPIFTVVCISMAKARRK
jgi:hypothetical protein